ncbi:MAG TPA: ABC transporter ATP-binding protein [Anaerolineae bacterium]|nr:ABC transporter ATP-binding protein [Anaerolineae bacterium]HQI84103.1 ABC transporter ATP-binding protein [Anaerolineae bacterium]
MNEPIIHTQNLHRDFTMGDQVVHALDGVELQVNAGDFLAVMGPSGSGKSTLLYLLGGLDRPTAGEIWVSGRDIAQLDENDLATYRGQEIGFVFQAFHLVPTMTALQNVEFPMIFNRVSPSARRERAKTLLDRVGLSDRMAHKPTELSGGQQQRVAIARALANDPRIILADEPTGNLDTHTGQEVLDLLTHLNREEGRTIIIVSHDPSVTRFVTRDIHLLDGKVVKT